MKRKETSHPHCPSAPSAEELDEMAFTLAALIERIRALRPLKGAALCLRISVTKGFRVLARGLQQAFVAYPELMHLKAQTLAERLLELSMGAAHCTPGTEADDENRNIRLKEENKSSSFNDDDDDNACAREEGGESRFLKTEESNNAKGISEVSLEASSEVSSRHDALASTLTADTYVSETEGHSDDDENGTGDEAEATVVEVKEKNGVGALTGIRSRQEGEEGPTEQSKAFLPTDYRLWTAEQFRTAAERCKGQMPPEQYEAFVYHWTEANPEGTMRFQEQRTFSMLNRMHSWLRKTRSYSLKEERELLLRCGHPQRPQGVEEVEAACRELGADVREAEAFFNHYEARGWRSGPNFIENWRSALKRWLANSRRTLRRQSMQLLVQRPDLTVGWNGEGVEKNEQNNNKVNEKEKNDEIPVSDIGYGPSAGGSLDEQLDHLRRAKINEERHRSADEDLFAGVDLDPAFVLP